MLDVEKFEKNMFCNKPIEIKIKRPINELKEELISIQNLKFDKTINFDCAIIPDEDKIIPTENQLNFWQDKVEIVKINSPHYPFKNYSSWSQILC